MGRDTQPSLPASAPLGSSLGSPQPFRSLSRASREVSTQPKAGSSLLPRARITDHCLPARCSPVAPQQTRFHLFFLQAVTDPFFHNEGGIPPSILFFEVLHAGIII